MAEKQECCYGLNLSNLAMGTPYLDPGVRKVVCAKCGKAFLTNLKGKAMCFDREEPR